MALPIPVFTPVAALVGGALIGAASVLLLWLNGRIAGVSGILGRALSGTSDDRAWRLLFLAGLVVGAGLYAWVGQVPPPRQGFPIWLLALAGLLVGYGTALGNGCTSGHGVCGLARLSRRSLAATMVFLATALLTTYVVRHVLGVGA
jgi:uncharacterized membrane protein YedE/YeeE